MVEVVKLHSPLILVQAFKLGFHGMSIRDLHAPKVFRAFEQLILKTVTSRNVNAALLAHTGGHPLLKLLPTALQSPQRWRWHHHPAEPSPQSGLQITFLAIKWELTSQPEKNAGLSLDLSPQEVLSKLGHLLELYTSH